MTIMTIKLLNIDCIKYMKTCKDNEFDLAIVDPPYGIGESGGKDRRGKTKHEKKDWDDAVPEPKYFKELQRVSKNQIIWGANYFTEMIPTSMGWICWDKKLDNSDFSDFELAYSSFDRAAKIFRYSKNGGSRKPAELADIIHPCQKPIKLYDWMLDNYANYGDKILDTHFGSASSAISAYFGGFEYVGCEKDKDYFEAAKLRVDSHTRQQTMF